VPSSSPLNSIRLACLESVLPPVGGFGLAAQTKQIITWQEELSYLQTLSPEHLVDQRDALAQIRAGIGLWLKLHPGISLEVPAAPPPPWSAQEMRSQVSSLAEIVARILKEDQGRPFELGVTTVSVTAEASPLSPVADTFDQEEILNHNVVNVAGALDFLPGVSIDHVSSNRNEAGIRIRGFSSRARCRFIWTAFPCPCLTMPRSTSTVS